MQHVTRLTVGISIGICCALHAQGALRYVALNGAHTPPFDTWEKAATDIQSAVDAAQNGDTVLVATGVYATSKKGQRSRVIVDKPITVKSSDGPVGTIILGEGPLDNRTSVRCAHLSNGAILEGFTLRDGHSSTSGSKYGERAGGGAYLTGGALLSNCIVEACNAKSMGAGVFILEDGRTEACTITANNDVNYRISGGGVACYEGGIVSACVIISNYARYGGGIYCYCGGTIEHCWLQGNQAVQYGGGAYSRDGGEIANSAVLQNSAKRSGGVYCRSSAGVRNCTIMGNHATKYGGIYMVKTSGMWNSIIYYNDAPSKPNWYSKDPLLDCCMVPVPKNYPALGANPGVVSIDNPRLVRDSICVDAGNNANAAGCNLFCGPRIHGAAVDIGADEYQGGYTGALAAAYSVDFPRAALNYPVTFTADIDGQADGYIWDFGDGACVSNNPVIRHAFSSTGVFTVTLSAWNTETTAMAAAAQTICHVYTNYVSLHGSHQWPFRSWAAAATNFDDAIAEIIPWCTVLVSNGTYHLTHQISLTKSLRLVSAAGAAATTLDANNQSRVLYIDDAAPFVQGFTLINGSNYSGGGIYAKYGGTVRDCLVRNCTATSGGGVHAYDGVLIWDCRIEENHAVNGGGAWIYKSVLCGCVIARNHSSGYASAVDGVLGQLESCTICGNTGGGFATDNDFIINNCILYHNLPCNYTNVYEESGFQYSCTTPLPAGTGNIAADPLLLQYETGDYRLATNSPCIDTGLVRCWMRSEHDLAGTPRVRGSSVDMGAYESTAPSSRVAR